jgi:hypothetical protein
MEALEGCDKREGRLEAGEGGGHGPKTSRRVLEEE